MKLDSLYRTAVRNISIPKIEYVERILKNLSPAEKIFLALLIIVFIVSSLSILSDLNDVLLSDVPAEGGTIIEGIVGSPRFINPLLAVTSADQDLSTLVYSGLMKTTPEGELMPDIASEFSISEDGLVYTFSIKEGARFHDGKSITADDVIYTIHSAQNPAIKSPRRASWDGVVIEKINDKEIRFILELPYTPFLQNTTLGILPEHIWSNADSEQFAFSQFNTEPVGSGPFMIDHIQRNDSGVAELYELKPFADYSLGKPYVAKIVIRLYPNENKLVDAYISGEIQSLNSISKNSLALIALNKKDFRVERSPLPRIFGVFFNQNQAITLAHNEVREALNIGLDKERVVNEVLGGNGTVIDSPIPPNVFHRTKSTEEQKTGTKAAIKLLEKHGWRVNEETGLWQKKSKTGVEAITFSIATSDVPELKRAAQIISEEWYKIGIPVEVKIFSPGDLNQNVIRPRKYDSLFFGEIVGRELDLFAFWHSSQRNDPGLNIALYANITADKILEDVRTVAVEKEQFDNYAKFEEEIKNDVPAVFVYVPDFMYVTPKNAQGISIKSLSSPHERFLNVHEWFINTDRVWKIFNR